MKYFITLVVLAICNGYLPAQNVGIGTNKPLSKLHIAGDLRVDSLATHDSGVVMYNRSGVLLPLKLTGKKSDVFRGDGTFQSIDAVTATSINWLTTGNSAVDTAINFLGTSDNKPLLFRVNNKRAGILDPQRGNVSLGLSSLSTIKTGINNIAFGTGALQHNTKGSNSIAIGDSALFNQDTATSVEITGPYVIESIAIGSKALFENYGQANTGVGVNALMENSISSWNTAIGYQSLMHNSTFMANYNTAVGVFSMFNNGSDFTFPGGPTYGSRNAAIGAYSLYHNVHGNQNVALGYRSLYNNDGSDNTAVGYYAMENNERGEENVAIGTYAMAHITNAWYNTAVGYQTLFNNTTGSNNTACGIFSMSENTTGSCNTAYGRASSASNGTGTFNSAFGMSALQLNSAGSFNTAMGSEALFSNKVSNQTAVGYQSMYSNTTGKTNSAFGYRSLYTNVTGSANVAAGYQALLSNTTGSSNVAAGMQALAANTTGVSNTAIGTRAIGTSATGVNNTAIGYGALLSVTSGVQNTAVGMYADVTSGNFSNATAIGYNAKVNASNKVRIGNALVTKIEGQVPFSTPSDGRFKFNVREDVQGLNFIIKLRPVSYQFDVRRFDEAQPTDHMVKLAYNSASEARRTGFIAQEVEVAAKSVGFNFSGILKPESAGDHYSLSYEAFVVPLVKGMQEQQIIIEQIREELKEQKTINERLMKAVSALQEEVRKVTAEPH